MVIAEALLQGVSALVHTVRPSGSRWRVGFVVVVVGVLTACTSSSDTTPSVTSSGATKGPAGTGSTTPASATSPTATTSGPSASAAAGALEAYRGFWAARVAANAHPRQRQPPELARYAIDTALANDQADLFDLRQENVEYRGEPLMNPRVIGVQLGIPPKVTIGDCIDVSHWIPVDVATGKSVMAPGQAMRVSTQSVATVFAGRWVIRVHTVFRDRAC